MSTSAIVLGGTVVCCQSSGRVGGHAMASAVHATTAQNMSFGCLPRDEPQPARQRFREFAVEREGVWSPSFRHSPPPSATVHETLRANHTESKSRRCLVATRLPVAGRDGLALAYAEHFCTTGWATPLCSWPPVLEGDSLWILDLPLCTAFHAICFHL